MNNHADSNSQPAPTGNGNPVAIEVVKDIIDRRAVGIKKYKTELRADNGRDPLVDLYQELLDSVMYVKQELMERDSAPAPVPQFNTNELKALARIVSVAPIIEHPKAQELYNRLMHMIRKSAAIDAS